MFDERFARQYRYELPSEFPLSSLFTGIVHHLSGPNIYAHTQTSHNWSVGWWYKIPISHFHYTLKFEHSWIRTHVRLLGPCFKTGWRRICCENTLLFKLEAETFVLPKQNYHASADLPVEKNVITFPVRDTQHMTRAVCVHACAMYTHTRPLAKQSYQISLNLLHFLLSNFTHF